MANEDSGIAGERFIDGLRTPELEDVIHVTAGSRDEMEAALEAGDVAMVLVVPAGMTDSLGAGEMAAIEVLYDGSSVATAGTGLSLPLAAGSSVS